jgi:hypothetical protein
VQDIVVTPWIKGVWLTDTQYFSKCGPVMNFLKKFSLMCVCITGLVGPAYATITSYTSNSSFAAAAGTMTADLGFDTLTTSDGEPAYIGNSLTISGVTFSGYLFTGDTSWHMDSYAGYNDPYLMSSYGMTIALPTYTTAVSFDFGAYFGNSTVVSAVATTSLGETVTITNSSASSFSFAGFTSSGNDDYIVSLAITQTSSANYEALDSLSYKIAAVPEPDSWGMLLAGLVLVGFAGRRVTRRAAARH